MIPEVPTLRPRATAAGPCPPQKRRVRPTYRRVTLMGGVPKRRLGSRRMIQTQDMGNSLDSRHGLQVFRARSACGGSPSAAKRCPRPFRYSIDGECDCAPYYRMNKLSQYLCPRALCPPWLNQDRSIYASPNGLQPKDTKMNERTQFAITSTTPSLSHESLCQFHPLPIVKPLPISRAKTAPDLDTRSVPHPQPLSSGERGLG